VNTTSLTLPSSLPPSPGTGTDGTGNVVLESTFSGSSSAAPLSRRLSTALFLGSTALLMLLVPQGGFLRTREALLFTVVVVALASAYHPQHSLVFAQSGDYRVDYVVYAPDLEFDSVSLHTSRGDITVDRMLANQITLSVAVGDIDGTQLTLAQRSNSRLSARVSDRGQITLDYVGAAEQGESARFDLDNEEGSASLHLRQGAFSGSYDVQVTGTGSAGVEGTLVEQTEDDSNHRLTGYLNSASGEHQVVVRANDGDASLVQDDTPRNPSSVPTPGTAPPATPPPSPSPSPGPSPSPPDTTPIGDNTYSEADFHYRLTQSTDGRTLWARPPTHRVLRSDRAPQNTRSGLHLSAAKNEFEPIQVCVAVGFCFAFLCVCVFLCFSVQ
jgi:Toastrack DUF4097